MKRIYIVLMLLLLSSQAYSYSEERYDGSISSGSIWEGSYIGEDGDLK